MLYLAWAQDESNDRFLGVYEGNMNDIEAYVKLTKNVGYGLKLEKANPIRIAEGKAAKIKNLTDKQRQLEKELAELKRQISIV